jgi:hypothetical protein
LGARRGTRDVQRSPQDKDAGTASLIRFDLGCAYRVGQYVHHTVRRGRFDRGRAGPGRWQGRQGIPRGGVSALGRLALGITPRMRNTILGSNRVMVVASLPAPPERVIDWFSVVLRALTKARDRVVVVTITGAGCARQGGKGRYGSNGL